MAERACGGCGDKENCYLCYLYATDAGHNKIWGGDGKVSPDPILAGHWAKRRASNSRPFALGDAVESALSLVGITKERVSSWIGRGCGCKERQEKLNALGSWAMRVLRGRIDKAQEYLDKLMEQPK